jgi:nitroimidazol reductase NimA-like FMN-containing flavoprotein (pyridoxamine 5'-phosphate oxidase superfamily)
VLVGGGTDRRRARTLSRLRHDLLPWNLLRAVDPLARTAVDNARRAAAEIGRSIEERQALMATVVASPREATEPSDSPHLVDLTRYECMRLLAERRLGRLAFVARAGQPLIVPVNYVVDGGSIWIASGPGPKLQAAERRDVVSFEVDDIDESTQQGWSVVVTGRAERLEPTSPEARTRTGALPLPPAWAPGPRRHLIRIRATRVSGRWLVARAPA